MVFVVVVVCFVVVVVFVFFFLQLMPSYLHCWTFSTFHSRAQSFTGIVFVSFPSRNSKKRIAIGGNMNPGLLPEPN